MADCALAPVQQVSFILAGLPCTLPTNASRAALQKQNEELHTILSTLVTQVQRNHATTLQLKDHENTSLCQQLHTKSQNKGRKAAKAAPSGQARHMTESVVLTELAKADIKGKLQDIFTDAAGQFKQRQKQIAVHRKAKITAVKQNTREEERRKKEEEHSQKAEASKKCVVLAAAACTLKEEKKRKKELKKQEAALAAAVKKVAGEEKAAVKEAKVVAAAKAKSKSKGKATCQAPPSSDGAHNDSHMMMPFLLAHCHICKSLNSLTVSVPIPNVVQQQLWTLQVSLWLVLHPLSISHCQPEAPQPFMAPTPHTATQWSFNRVGGDYCTGFATSDAHSMLQSPSCSTSVLAAVCLRAIPKA
ncbi:uncharacterized protein C8Q71DRAFT_727124 [Rhodofomes roseus]|uniref:Uncharacterized protein n=1 Tax=Rhodofomes roseus TaxID=34475 RepID=A0ABQ8K2H1_9APHY|nr:uncharacterized protein C8Q71DRAFT_727124 [Rhodofomes roseus]KAH9830932.1 hypothetical protein C8Q71DRAFT_727124 [Rhodofomes roseus]